MSRKPKLIKPFVMGNIAYRCANCEGLNFKIIEFLDITRRPHRSRRFLQCCECMVPFFFPTSKTKRLRAAQPLKRTARYHQKKET